jgi:beta-glucosidase
MMKLIFPKNFIWGAASASYQIEGAANEDGRGESIWDRYSHIPGNTLNNDTGDVACDYYHRYQEDVALMKKMGIQGYRFSFAWPRIFPEGRGKLNQKGLDYYSHLVDELQNAGIIPFATLYHWDLPQFLQDRGGWANPDTAKYFADYSALLFEQFEGRVPYWMTLNEPYCVSFLGNYVGRHAPGYRDYSLALRVAYYLYVAHGLAVKRFREGAHQGEIGIALNLMSRLPYDKNNQRDVEAAKHAEDNLNRWFLDPLLKGGYPQDVIEWYKQKGLVLPSFNQEEVALMGQKLDFLGLNYYNDFWVRHNPAIFPDEGELKNPPHIPVNARNWPITEQGFTEMLLRLKNEYGVSKILITENGTATHDIVSVEHRVEDTHRVDYLKRHIAAMYRGIEKGVTVFGYLQWSFTDNFEWAFGYESRFGLVYIDYQTQERIVKLSGEWYAELIKNNGFEMPEGSDNTR